MVARRGRFQISSPRFEQSGWPSLGPRVLSQLHPFMQIFDIKGREPKQIGSSGRFVDARTGDSLGVIRYGAFPTLVL